MRNIVIAAGLVAITGQPAAAKQKLFVQTEKFDAASIAWAAIPGSSTVKGSAVLRTLGGEAKTCAGLQVLLIPVSAYSTERMIHQFGEAGRGLQLERSLPFATTDPAYLSSMRRTRCDAVGSFEFNSLPRGSFYVVANVTWSAPSRFGLRPQGGEILERIEVDGQETKQIVVTS